MEDEIFNSGAEYVQTKYIISTPTSSALGPVAVLAGLFVWFLVVLGGYAISCWLMSRVFKKFGEKPIKAWIPFYNVWKFLELGGQKGFWMFVPGANTIFMILSAYNLGKKIGKSDAFVLLYIFLQPIWAIIVGSKSSPIVAGAPTAVTPDNQFTQQPVAYQPTPVIQDVTAPVTPSQEAPAPAEAEPVTTEEPQDLDDTDQIDN